MIRTAHDTQISGTTAHLQAKVARITEMFHAIIDVKSHATPGNPGGSRQLQGFERRWGTIDSPALFSQPVADGFEESAIP